MQTRLFYEIKQETVVELVEEKLRWLKRRAYIGISMNTRTVATAQSVLAGKYLMTQRREKKSIT